MADSTVSCPFCDYQCAEADSYFLVLHVEELHTDDSPFRVDEGSDAAPSSAAGKAPAKDPDELYVECPEEECGEELLLVDLNEHLDMHEAERLTLEENPASPSSSNMTSKYRSTHSYFPKDYNGRTRRDENTQLGFSEKRTSLGRNVLDAFSPNQAHKKQFPESPHNGIRLGRSDLGKYAWEKRMPSDIYKMIERGPKVKTVNRLSRDGRVVRTDVVENETCGILPVLAQLSQLDKTVATAYYCHPSTKHIGKHFKEGWLCGYRNIQMLISYIQGSNARGHEQFPGRVPGILKLQDDIENAWDRGICAIERARTGGIRGTRKWIGSPEASALFMAYGLGVHPQHLGSTPHELAYQQLFTAVEVYFAQGATLDDSEKVHKTLLPPLYMQQPGHSLTIVGFERYKDGSANIIVFDPSYKPSPALQALIGQKHITRPRSEILRAFRKGQDQLRRKDEIEILQLTDPAPLFPAWHVHTMCFPDPGAEITLFYVFFDTLSSTFSIACANDFVDVFPWQVYCELYIWEESRFINASKIRGPNQRDSLLEIALGARTCYGLPDLSLFTRSRNWPNMWTFSLNSLFGLQYIWPQLICQCQYCLDANENCMHDCAQGYEEEFVPDGQRIDAWVVQRSS